MSPGKNLFVWVTAKSRALLIRDGQLEKLWGPGDVQKKNVCAMENLMKKIHGHRVALKKFMQGKC